jgi:hypothetical protein
MLLILLVVRMVLQKDLVLDTLLDVGMNKQELENQSSTTLVYAAYAFYFQALPLLIGIIIGT